MDNHSAVRYALTNHLKKYISLTDEELEYVLSRFTLRRFDRHHTVIHAGKRVNEDFFLLKGLMKAAHIGSEGKEHIVKFAAETCWITDPHAYYSGSPATYTVDCLEDCRVLALSLDRREELCKNLQKMEYYFRKKTTEEYISLQKRTLCLISGTARERYEDLLQEYPDLLQRVTKSMIASYLGVSRETLSRLQMV